MDWLWLSNSMRARAFIAGMLPVLAIGVFLAAGPVWRAYAWIPESALNSDRLRITHDLASTWLNEVPEVLILGGSQAREIFPDAQWMSRELSRACRRQIRVLAAASSSQPLETTWAIADHFSTRAPELTVLAPNLMRDRFDPAVASRLARSRFAIAQPITPEGPSSRQSPVGLESLKVQLGIVFADAITATGLHSRPQHRATDPFDSRQHTYVLPALGERRKLVEARFAEMRLARLSDATLQANVEAYRLLTSRIRRRGGQVLLLSTPVSPVTADVWGRADQRLAAAHAHLVAADVELDLRASSGLEDKDFFDDVHLLRSGRVKLWPVLRRSLLENLRCEPAARP